MSAFIVSESTMHRCVAALLTDRDSSEDGDKLGRELYAMNARAVGDRYPCREHDDCAGCRKLGSACTTAHPEHANLDPIPEYRYRPTFPRPIVKLKSLECLRYQCSEGEVPEEPLYARLTDAINHLRGEIVRALPEYRNAEGWD